MRTTVAFDDQVLEQARRQALAQNVSLNRYIEAAVREKLAAEVRERAPDYAPLKTFREDSPDHGIFRDTLSQAANGPAPFGLSRVAVSGFLKIVTNRRVFPEPAPLDAALEFCDDLAQRPGFRWVDPGAQHWRLFSGLCRQLRAVANLIPDLWFAALAIESGSTWVTGDRDYGQVPGLDWQFVHR